MVGWREATPDDRLFAYRLAVELDQRWPYMAAGGRSRSPFAVLDALAGLEAVAVLDGPRGPAGLAGLHSIDRGNGAAHLELVAAAGQEALVHAHAAPVVEAVFALLDPRRLYHERIAGGPDLLSASGPWRCEVRQPAHGLDGPEALDLETMALHREDR